ncbi:MAG: HXXEE domain-containing protein [Gemmataceae bacterium]
MYARLKQNWVYGGFLSAFVLFGLVIVLLRDSSLAFVLVYLHLPIYQLHQYEEHDDDRFRKFINEVFGNGRDIMTVDAVFIINIGAVWALYTAVIIASALYDIGLGLVLVYTTLLNGIAHLGQGLAFRKYNPGLGTSLLLFLPVSSFALWSVSQAQGVGVLHHLVGVLVGVIVHVVIVVYVVRRLRQLKQ